MLGLVQMGSVVRLLVALAGLADFHQGGVIPPPLLSRSNAFGFIPTLIKTKWLH